MIMKSLYGEGENPESENQIWILRMKFLGFEDWINMVTLTDWLIEQIFNMVNFNGVAQCVNVGNTKKAII